MAAVRLTKMSGAGNDFVVLGPDDGRPLVGDAQWVRRVCRRRLSVGADGVLLVEPSGPDRVRVEFRNPDGSPAFCGNGTRCAARYARLQGWVGDKMVLETAAGEVQAEIREERVRLTLPSPRDLGRANIEFGGENLTGRQIDAGVPHFVVDVDDLDEAPLELWGPPVRRHVQFGSAGANLDLVERVSNDRIRIRTWERGVEGETLACGSGAVAAALAVRLTGGPEALAVVPASGVTLQIRLPGAAGSPEAAVVTGDARVVFEGTLGADAASGFEVP